MRLKNWLLFLFGSLFGLFVWYICNSSWLSSTTIDNAKHADNIKSTTSNTHRPVSCDRMQFEPRTVEAAKTAKERWQGAVTFVRKRRLSFLNPKVMNFHKELLDTIETKGVDGMILDCGVAKAGSSIIFAAIKRPDRCIHLFDTFEGIPAPSASDGADVHQRYDTIQSGKAGRNYYGYMKNLMQFDVQQFSDAGIDPKQNAVSFHKGLFNATVWPSGPVAYAHLDGDWYESTFGMLVRISPYISVGGYFVLDDCDDWSGARSAFQDFFGVDYYWLVANHECASIVGGIQFRVFHSTRAGAQRVERPHQGLPACSK